MPVHLHGGADDCFRQGVVLTIVRRR
jgi:hypothetical protein